MRRLIAVLMLVAGSSMGVSTNIVYTIKPTGSGVGEYSSLSNAVYDFCHAYTNYFSEGSTVLFDVFPGYTQGPYIDGTDVGGLDCPAAGNAEDGQPWQWLIRGRPGAKIGHVVMNYVRVGFTISGFEYADPSAQDFAFLFQDCWRVVFERNLIRFTHSDIDVSGVQYYMYKAGSGTSDNSRFVVRDNILLFANGAISRGLDITYADTMSWDYSKNYVFNNTIVCDRSDSGSAYAFSFRGYPMDLNGPPSLSINNNVVVNHHGVSTEFDVSEVFSQIEGPCNCNATDVDSSAPYLNAANCVNFDGVEGAATNYLVAMSQVYVPGKDANGIPEPPSSGPIVGGASNIQVVVDAINLQTINTSPARQSYNGEPRNGGVTVPQWNGDGSMPDGGWDIGAIQHKRGRRQQK